MPFKQQWWADYLCMGVWENHLDERGDLLAHEQTKPQHNESPQPILGFEAKSVFWVQVDFCPFIVETKEELNKNIYIDNRQWRHPASVPAPLTFAQPTFSQEQLSSNVKPWGPRATERVGCPWASARPSLNMQTARSTEVLYEEYMKNPSNAFRNIQGVSRAPTCKRLTRCFTFPKPFMLWGAWR